MAEKGNDADQLVALSRILHNMTVSIVTDERLNVLTIRGRVTGLPKVEDVIRELGELR